MCPYSKTKAIEFFILQFRFGLDLKQYFKKGTP